MGRGDSLSQEQGYLLLGVYHCILDDLEVLGRDRHVVVGDLEVGIVGNLDGTKSITSQADAVVASCVSGGISCTMVPIGIGGASSQP